MSTNPYFCSVLIGSHGYNLISILCTRQSYIMVLLLHTIIEIVCMWPQNRRVEKTCCWVLLVCNYMSMTLVCLLFSLNLSQIFTIYYLLSPSALGYSSSAAVSPTVAPFYINMLFVTVSTPETSTQSPAAASHGGRKHSPRFPLIPSFPPPLSTHFPPTLFPHYPPTLSTHFPLSYTLISPTL